MAGQFGRIAILGFAVAFVLAAGGCLSSDSLEEAKGALSNLGSTLLNKMSANYDPPDYDGPPLGQIPSYQLGDSYTYSSGRTETITNLGGDRITWRNDLNSEFDRFPNFVLPTAATRTDKGQVTRNFDVSPDVLWPLIPGTKRQFVSEVTVRLQGQNAERKFRRDWICTVNGAESVTVQFGEFNAVKISCERYSRGRWRQTRVWYYVPEIGHYVRRVDRYQGREPRDIELLSIQQAFTGLSRGAKRALYDLEQSTLERMPSGKPASWRSGEGNFAIKMTVMKTMQTEAGQFCRTFRQEIRGGGIERIVPGLACRTWNGRWVRL